MAKIDYPAGDFLIRVKNTARAEKRELLVAKTKLVKEIAQVLVKEGYLDEVKENKRDLKVKLAYRHKAPVLIDLKLVSKPGLRIYMGVNELAKIRGPSIFILSTPKGVMSLREALKKRVGGEVMVEIW